MKQEKISLHTLVLRYVSYACLIQHFEKTDSVADEHPSRRPSLPQATVGNVEDSFLHLEEHSTVKEILRQRWHLYPYYIRQVQDSSSVNAFLIVTS